MSYESMKDLSISIENDNRELRDTNRALLDRLDEARRQQRYAEQRAAQAEAALDAARSELREIRSQLAQAQSALKEIIEDVVNHPGEFDADSEIVRIAREAIA